MCTHILLFCMCTYIVIYVILTVQWERYCHITAPIYLKEGVILPLTESQKKANTKYREKSIKRIPLDVQKEKYEKIKIAAEAAGESVNGYIKKAVDQRMEQDCKK